MKFNSYGTNPTKWSNTLKQFIGNRVSLSVFDHFLRLALNGLGWFYLAKFNFVMFPKILTLSYLVKLDITVVFEIEYIDSSRSLGENI